ncbi:Alpha-glucuronidase A [Cyphellophora attinorum]|uniref:Alpha-glucuronidase n=1 Tax=Cyphellophora attinorum TaxID=1664694 RepID=A0A0N0NIC0_9EURO|nr:Alpha-glucuronidase A [Phialophora attinorum]KPI35259.1 Alpha-glucuronidase A [Phialophora attinorum]
MRAALLLLLISLAAAENGIDAWLRYAPIPEANSFKDFVPSTIVVLNDSQISPVYTAGQELQQGINSILGQRCQVAYEGSDDSSIIVGTVEAYASTGGSIDGLQELIADGYYISTSAGGVLILGENERGALYGAFAFLETLATGNLSAGSYASNPDAPVRWVNQWDNMRDGGTHGSVERGYGGKSIFFWDGQYARLLASIGINGIVINNVNANETTINDTNIEGVARVADAFRPYGIQIGLSLYFSSPANLSHLDTFDPLNEEVIAWWNNKTTQIYSHIPDFAGYLVKANSEGQPGPLTYNRTLAEGANLFARALQPHGGTVMFRAFVYDSKTLNQTTNWKADRANAAVEFFDGLDGKFEDNVVIQIKYGPIDFQVREPVSPLFTHLENTATSIELQITQEYLGQQAHLVYLPPMWRELLDFDLRVDSQPTPLTSILNGSRFGTKRAGGYAGVVNVGTNTTWLGSHLAMSNLYAFGKTAWYGASAPSPSEIIDTWTRLTFSHDPTVISTINALSLASWPTYENYTGNLGLQTLTDILLGHYGPNPASQDGNPWGQWTRADGNSIGMDRTVSNGTGFAGQYPTEVAEMYERIETTPDELMLWFHHVGYTQKLHSGKTVLQHIYDAHYEGAAMAQTFPVQWEGLKGLVDEERYEHVLYRLRYQAGHSLVWRDSICNFYFNKSGIADELGRVGNYRYRIEAEEMELVEGYKVYQVKPFEAGSGGGWAIATIANNTRGVAEASLDDFFEKSGLSDGTYDVAVNYYDQALGNSTWELWLMDGNGEEALVGEWKGDLEYNLGRAPSPYIDGQTAARVTFNGVQVGRDMKLRIVGVPDGLESAAVDYVSILPEGVVD